MSQFPSVIDDPLQPVRAAAVDSVVKANRKRTPPEIVNQRSVQRMSVEELNNSSWEDVEKRFHSQRLDTRPPYVKVLDLLDLPRNVVAGYILDNSARRAKEAEGETGAFGIGRVNFSDILRDMGVQNHAVRGILGFVGDVALDPLTYAGGAGVGLRAVGAGGKVAETATMAGTRAFRSGIKAAAEQGLGFVRDPLVRNVLEKSGFTAEKLAEMRTAGNTSEQILQEIRKVTQGGAGASREASPVKRFFGGSLVDTEGTLGRNIAEPIRSAEEATAESARRAALGIDISPETLIRQGAEGQAARDFFAAHGRSAGTQSKSLRLFRGSGPGVQVGHIPFTDFNVQVPAFSASGRIARAAGALASVSKEAELTLDPHVESIKGIAEELVDHAQQATKDTDELARLDAVKPSEIMFKKALAAEEERKFGHGGPDSIDAFNTERDYHNARQAIIDRRDGLVDAAGNVIQGGRTDRIAELTGNLRNAEQAIRAAGQKGVKPTAEGLLALNSYKDAIDAAVNRLSTESVSGEQKLSEAVALRADIAERTRISTDAVSRLKNAQTSTGERVRSFLAAGPDGAEPHINPDRATIARVSGRVLPMLDQLEEAEAALRGGQGVRKVEAGSPGALFEGVTNPRGVPAAQAKVSALRDQIEAETAPLRQGITEPVEDVLKRIHQEEINRLSSVQRELVDESSETYRSLQATVEARRAGIASAVSLAAATESSIVQHLTSQEKDIVALANMALGVNDFVTGSSLFADIGVGVRDILGKDSQAAEYAFRMDQAAQRTFGRRSGMFARVVRNSERMGTTEARRMYGNMAMQFRNKIQQAMREADVPAGKLGEVESLATMIGYDMRVRAAVDALQDQRYYTEAWKNADGSIVKNAFTLIEESRKSGLLANAKLRSELEKIAGESLHLFDEMGDVAVADEYLTALREGYIPTLLTKEANEAIEKQVRIAAKNRGPTYIAPATDASGKLEGFQRVRTTDQARFVRSDGKLVRFFEMDRTAMEPYIHNQELMERIKTVDPPLYESIKDTIQTIEEYDRMPASIRPPMRQTDAFEMNELAMQGRFAPLTGRADLTDGFANTSLIHLVGARSAAQQRAYARRALQNNVMAAPGLTIDAGSFINQAQKKGERATLSGGATVNLVGNGIVEVGDKRYRKLNRDLFPWDNPMTAALGDLRDTKVFEESVATRLEKAAQAFRPENVPEILKGVDQALGVWKSLTLGLAPSWEVAEITGNLILAWMSGAPFGRVLAHLMTEAKAQWFERNPEALAKLSYSHAGETVDGAGHLTYLSHAGVTDTGQMAESVAMMMKNKVMALPGAVRMPKEWNPIKTWQRAKAVAEESKPFAYPGSTGNDSMFRSFFAPWFNLNRKVNNTIKAAVFMAFLDEGHDVASAAERTIHGMFDMEDLTKADKGMRRILPFYSWVRANGVYQMHELFARPMYAAMTPKVQSAIEELLAGDERVPQHMRPAWLREQMAAQIGADPEKRWAVLLRNLAPQSDAIEYLQPILGWDGAQAFLNYFAGSFNPVFKVPLEIGSGHEFFGGRTIAPTAEEGDLSIPEHLLGQIRPLKELGIGSNQMGPIERGFQQGAGAGISRLLLAGRAQDFSDQRLQRQLLREFKDRESGLRNAIARAERNGRQADSLQGRVELMQLYGAMRDAKIPEQEIPKWARLQLDRLEATTG